MLRERWGERKKPWRQPGGTVCKNDIVSRGTDLKDLAAIAIAVNGGLA
jgi:hypothetical protein